MGGRLEAACKQQCSARGLQVQKLLSACYQLRVSRACERYRSGRPPSPRRASVTRKLRRRRLDACVAAVEGVPERAPTFQTGSPSPVASLAWVQRASWTGNPMHRYRLRARDVSKREFHSAPACGRSRFAAAIVVVAGGTYAPPIMAAPVSRATPRDDEPLPRELVRHEAAAGAGAGATAAAVAAVVVAALARGRGATFVMGAGRQHEPPPGGASTRIDGREPITFPTFWHAKLES